MNLAGGPPTCDDLVSDMPCDIVPTNPDRSLQDQEYCIGDQLVDV